MSEFPTWRQGVNWTNRVSYYSIGFEHTLFLLMERMGVRKR